MEFYLPVIPSQCLPMVQDLFNAGLGLGPPQHQGQVPTRNFHW